MTAYKQDSAGNIIKDGNTTVPLNITLKEYQDYLQWVEDGGVTGGADPEPLEFVATKAKIQASEDAKAEAKQDKVTQYIASHTPEEIRDWVQTKLPSLPSQEAAFISRLFVAIGALYRGI